MTAGARDKDNRQGFSSWVLTRLHPRYDRTSRSGDLIFKAAPPMMVGRAQWNATAADAGAQQSNLNDVQGRSLIHNDWKGADACANPKCDAGVGRPARTPGAIGQCLALASRGKVSLKSSVVSLGLTGQPPVERKIRSFRTPRA